MTFFLIFTEPLSAIFFIIYLSAGVSDILDGYFARKFNVVSEFGSRLDSISDYFFYIVMVYKIFPMLWETLPEYIWIAVVSITLFRILVYLYAGYKYHRFVSLHTILNKASGFGFFAMPFALRFSFITPLCIAVAFITGSAVAEELLIHLKVQDYHSNIKSIFHIKQGE